MTLGRNGFLRYGHLGEFLESFWEKLTVAYGLRGEGIKVFTGLRKQEWPIWI